MWVVGAVHGSVQAICPTHLSTGLGKLRILLTDIVYIPRLTGIFHNNINSCFGGVVNAYDSNFQHYDIIFLRERRFESCRQLIFFLPFFTNSPSTHAGDVVWKWVEFGSSGPV
jgi:hypothetical protein